MGLNIVQVGSHKGYDDLSEIVKKYKPEEIDNLILVEPQDQYNNSLHECYNGYHPKIENIVISLDENKDTINFYYTSETEVSSVDPSHLIKHAQYKYNVKEFPALTINNLLEKYKIYVVDVLFIDAEGIDDKIIMSIDFDRYDIHQIYYENLHINCSVVSSFLKDKGYSIQNNILSNGWTNKATKIK